MSKNRNIADLLDANGDVKSTHLDNVPAVDLTNLNASNLTSGSIPDARVPASAVSQHATSFDDNKIVNDLSTLGLRVHAQENLSASNTNSASFDTFQDTSGITNLTNVQRASGEFIFAGTEGSPAVYDYQNANTKAKIKFTNFTANNGSYYEIDNDGDTSLTGTQYVIPANALAVTGGNYATHTGGNSNPAFTIDFGNVETFNIGKYQIGKMNTWGDINKFQFEYSTDGNSFSNVDLSNATQESIQFSLDHTGNSTTQGGTFTNGANDGTANLAQHHTSRIYVSVVQLQNIPIITARYFRLTGLSYHGGTNSDNAGWGYFSPLVSTFTPTATGSFEGNTITASSSTNKMGAVITYQDNAGTNALNTDIVLKLSADGGSNYSTATLTALPDFSTGIKMAKVNDLSVTAGTSLKYKLEFANQSASKIARIRGVSLQY